MQFELMAKIFAVAGLTCYMVWSLRKELPSRAEAAILIAGGTIMIVGSILPTLFFDTLPASERIVDVLLLAKFRVVPGGAIPLGYACILAALARYLGLSATKKMNDVIHHYEYGRYAPNSSEGRKNDPFLFIIDQSLSGAEAAGKAFGKKAVKVIASEIIPVLAPLIFMGEMELGMIAKGVCNKACR